MLLFNLEVVLVLYKLYFFQGVQVLLYKKFILDQLVLDGEFHMGIQIKYLAKGQTGCMGEANPRGITSLRNAIS